MASSTVIRCLGAIPDSTLRERLTRFFSGESVAFESFPEASGIIDRLGKSDVDFIIFDATLPDTGSVRNPRLSWFIQEGRRIRPGLPILALLPPTPDDEIKRLAYASGVTDFLSLPLSETELVCRVRSLAEMALSRRRDWNSVMAYMKARCTRRSAKS